MRIIDATKLKESFRWSEVCRLSIKEILDIIDNAPTVEKEGQWIKHYDCSDGFTWLTCSRCMFKAHEDDYNYCPYCGAYMKGKNNND